MEGGAKGCDVEPVKTGPDEEFELLISSVFEYFSILGKYVPKLVHDFFFYLPE